MTASAPLVITVVGEMTVGLRAEFDDVELRVAHGVTHLYVHGDAATLHGLLHRIESLGLVLLDVQRGPARPVTGPRPPRRG